MLGTSFEAQGGISTVVNVYRKAGLFDRWPITYIPTHTTAKRTVKLLFFFKAFFTFCGNVLLGRVALVHVHAASRNSFWRKTPFFLVCLFTKIPYIIHLHGGEFMLFFHDESGTFVRKFIKLMFDKASYVVVLSSQWQKRMQAIVSNENIVVIFNPMTDPDCVANGALGDEKVFLFLGFLERGKGVYELVEAVAKAREKCADLKLYCGGTGDVAGVTRLIKELQVEDSVKLLGWVGGENKHNLFQAAYAYVLPSYNEGLPMGILEAMSYGKPVISTPVGGIPDAVEDGVQGILVSPGSVDELAAAIVTLCDNEKLKTEMGNAARHKYESCFSPGKIIPQVENLYRRLGASPCCECQKEKE